MVPETINRPTILIVDDGVEIIEVLVELLAKNHEIIFSTTGLQALKLVAATPDLILLDINMPDMDGYSVCRELKANKETRDIPVIFLTSCSNNDELIKGFAVGAVDFITKPFLPNELLARVATHLQLRLAKREVELKNAELDEARQLVQRQKEELAEWNANLKNRVLQQTALIRNKAEEVRQYTDRNQSMTDVYIHLFTRMLELRHTQLIKRARGVTTLAMSMATTLKLPMPQRKTLETAAMLHDIGLVCASDRVAMFQGALAQDDYNEYLNHPVTAEDFLYPIEGLREIGRIIRHHHENFGGNGYPDKLAGKKIPLESQIIGAANYIYGLFTKETGDDAKYRITSKMALVMGNLFDPDLSIAADRAIQEFTLEVAPANPPHP